MRRDIDKATYETLADTFAQMGATLVTGEHEGSTYVFETDDGRGMYLCASDGAYWLDDDDDWPADWEWANDGAIVAHA